jgi:hypothetical protein
MLIDNMDNENILKPDEPAAESILSEEFDLSQNYPNPANPSSTINFKLPESGKVSLRIFNILGQEVKTLVDEHREAGSYTFIWDGKNNRGLSVPSGIYLYTIKAGDNVVTKKLMLLK